MIKHPFSLWQALQGRLYGHQLVYVLPTIFASCVQPEPHLQVRKLRATLPRPHVSVVKLGDPRQCDSRAILFDCCLLCLEASEALSEHYLGPMKCSTNAPVPYLSFIITAIQPRRTKPQQACLCSSSFSIHSRVYTQ